ncbi:MAG: DUF2628 domain-containing protein [Thermodesulfobacteriota bacterium]
MNSIYRCNDCARDISEQELEARDDMLCSECGGHVEEIINDESVPLEFKVDPASHDPYHRAILGEKNRLYYLNKFALFEEQAKEMAESWNWWAFFFNFTWALYRKMYGWFFILVGVGIITDIVGGAGVPMIALLATVLAYILFGTYANALYLKTLNKKIAKAQERISDKNELLVYLRRIGGVNSWVIWVFVVLPLIGIAAAVIIPQFAQFAQQ